MIVMKKEKHRYQSGSREMLVSHQKPDVSCEENAL